MSELFPEAYAIYNNDSEVRFKSTSGGVFTLFAEYFIKALGGTVYGAAFDSAFEVYHSRIKETDKIAKLRGSKYPQSKIGDTYKTVKKDLDLEKYVLFVGTPCQVSGLKSYLGKRYEKLYCMDFVCHGVASNGIWRNYLKQFKKRGEVKHIVFKYKFRGWKKWYFHVDYMNGSFWQRRGSMTSFMNSYLSYANIRPSCYQCHFKGLVRDSDFTISDCWGIGEEDAEMNDNNGLSALLLQNQRAKAIFENLKGNTTYKKYDACTLMQGNWTTFRSVEKNPKRENFFKMVYEKNGVEALNKFFAPGIKQWMHYYLLRIRGKEK